MNIYAQIYDANGAFETYYFNQTITVFPEESNQIEIIMEKLISGDPNFVTNQILTTRSYLEILHEIQRIASELNKKSMQDKLGVIIKTSKIKKFDKSKRLQSSFNQNKVLLIASILLRLNK